jgi:hypothetical protein
MIAMGSLCEITNRLKTAAVLSVAQVQLVADFCNFSSTFSELRAQFEDYWADFYATTHILTTTASAVLGDSLRAKYIIAYDEKRTGRREFRVSLLCGYTESKLIAIDALSLHALLDITSSPSFKRVLNHVPGMNGFSVKRLCIQSHILLFVRQSTGRIPACSMGLYLTKTACARLESFIDSTQELRQKLFRDAAYANMHMMATCRGVSPTIREQCASCPAPNDLMLPSDDPEGGLMEVHRRIRMHPCVNNTHTVALEVKRYIKTHFADRKLDQRFKYRAFINGVRSRTRREVLKLVRYEVMASMNIV